MSSDPFVIADQIWVLMEPNCLGKKSDPGRIEDVNVFRTVPLPDRVCVHRLPGSN